MNYSAQSLNRIQRNSLRFIKYLWVMELETGRTNKLTTDAADDSNPRWSADSKAIVFDSVRNGVSNFYRRAVFVVEEEKALMAGEAAKTQGTNSRIEPLRNS